MRTENSIITKPDVKHTKAILALLHLEDAKEVGSPGQKLDLTEENKQLLPEEQASVYRSAVGCAMYLAQDRRDIAYAAKELARRLQKPRFADWQALKHLGRYLKGTQDVVSIVQVTPGSDPPGEWSLQAFVDSDWAGCPETRKSTGGEVYTLCGAVIDSCVQTQPGVPATSSGEAEYRVMVRGAQHLKFLQNLCKHDFGVGTLIPKMWTDSSAALQMSKRLGVGKIRHLELYEMALQQMVKRKQVLVDKVLGTKNPANALTKHLGPAQAKEALEWLGLFTANIKALTTREVKVAAIHREWKPRLPEVILSSCFIAALTLG